MSVFFLNPLLGDWKSNETIFVVCNILAVFLYQRTHYPSGRTILSNLKTGTRRIMCLEEISSLSVVQDASSTTKTTVTENVIIAGRNATE